jgi:hypothetical protein
MGITAHLWAGEGGGGRGREKERCCTWLASTTLCMTASCCCSLPCAGSSAACSRCKPAAKALASESGPEARCAAPIPSPTDSPASLVDGAAAAVVSRTAHVMMRQRTTCTGTSLSYGLAGPRCGRSKVGPRRGRSQQSSRAVVKQALSEGEGKNPNQNPKQIGPPNRTAA